jgi:hypothetical protein
MLGQIQGLYKIQLSDPEKRQCLLGPNIRGIYTESVEVRVATTTTQLSPAGSVSNIADSRIPEDNSESNKNTSIILVGSITAFVLLLVGMIIYRRTKRIAKRARNKETFIVDSIAEPPVVHLDLSRSNMSFGSKLSLRRYDTESRSIEEQDDNDDIPRMSLAMERPSADTVDKYINKL